jgi:hypothetical protein
MSHDERNIEVQLAALADGTLPSSQREQVLARIEQSPELAAELERQRHAVAILGSLRNTQAPAALHSSIQSLTAGAASPRRQRRRRRRVTARLRLAAAGALAAVAVAAFILALTTAGTTGEPTVQQAARLALGPATLAAPAESPRDHGVLASSVEGIAYPYWQSAFGWQAAGARTDRLAGRTVTTVFYTHSATYAGPGRIGYAIVAGPALALPNGAVSTLRGVRFHILTSDGATVVTWRRAGHTCILVARGVSSGTLVHLAAWE